MISGDKVRAPAYGEEQDVQLDELKGGLWTATVLSGPYAGNIVSVAPSQIKPLNQRLIVKLEKKQVWPKG